MLNRLRHCTLEVPLGMSTLLGLAVLWRGQSWWTWWRQTLAAMRLHDQPQWRHDRPGPHLRWETVLAAEYGLEWTVEASEPRWSANLGNFVDSTYKHFNIPSREHLFCVRVAASTLAPREPRVCLREPVPWERERERERAGGDPSPCRTSWRQQNRDPMLQWHLVCQERPSAAPRTPGGFWCRHVFRELNKEAELLTRVYRN